MNRDAYIAQAAALQVAAAIAEGHHFFCKQFPLMDVARFLTALGEEVSDAASVSFAFVGYGLSDTDLRDRLSAIGLAVGHVTTDLHVAAKWRNEPDMHSTIIALATGRHPGVSTLAHFPQGDTRSIVQRLLRWAQQPQAELASTAPQRKLLEVLAEERDLSPLVSLSDVAAFLATWHEHRDDDELGAPRRALPRLGLLPDRDLLSASHDIAGRLLKNFKLTQEIAKMAGHRFEEVRRRVKRRSPDDQTIGLSVLERSERIRRFADFDAYSDLDFEEARETFEPTSRSARRPTGPTPQPAGIRDISAVARDAGERLIDGDSDALGNIVNGIQNALTDAVDGDDDSASGYYEIDGHELPFEFPLDRETLTWVRSFCSTEVWGGFYEVPTASIEDAIRNYRQCEPTRFEPLQQSIPHDGHRYKLRVLIEQMQQALAEQGGTAVDLCGLWDGIVAKRGDVLRYLDILIHLPMAALAGEPSLRAAVTALLTAWDQFYAELAQHHAAMHDIDHAWTLLLFEAIASLDVVQIKANLDVNRTSWKAILLPAHPLHLWRYERIAALSRGLKPDGMDRPAVLEQLQKPEHYLGVIYLSSLPEGRGGSQQLPVARDYGGLAVFENLRNAYSGDDGADALHHCVRQFAQIYVNHTSPLRVALINPPNASRMLTTLLSRTRGARPLRARLLVDIYATPGHEDRLLGARRFSTEDRDRIEEHIAAERLQLRVHDDKVLFLSDRLQALRMESPVHIVAVFDEATTAMRHQPAGINLLPMSPFAIRRRIRFQGINGRVDLHPSLENSVFRSFYDMIGRLHGVQSGQTPQASADADRMAQYIDTALKGTPAAALWFFFADRALPSPGRVSATRILERQDGRRRSVCYDASYERLALLLRQPLDRFNLRFAPNELQELLKEGVALLGDGIIDLFKADAQPDNTRVLGFAGMLIAARDYRDRYPDALLVSVDTKLARLWLRLTDSTERCDLLALRREDGVLTVEAAEIKTTGSDTSVPDGDIQKAKNQLMSTLQAIRSGLDEDEQATPLSAPRQEMLKEVFVSGCQAVAANREDRTRWVRWLKDLFRQADSTDDEVRQTENADGIRLRGIVYAVELSNNGPEYKEMVSDDPYDVTIYRLREERIQSLVAVPVSLSRRQEGEDNDRSSSSPSPHPTSPPPSPPAVDASADREMSDPDPESGSLKRSPGSTEDTPMPLGIRFAVGHSISSGKRNPYYLNPSNTKLNQLNIGVVGDLGTGKTQLTKALIYRFTRQATENRGHAPKFLIFDYKHDYTKDDFVEAVGARVVSPHRIPLNVFDLHCSRGHLPAARLGRVKFLNDVLQKIYGNIGPRQRNHLKTSVMRAYESRADCAPTLTDVLREYADLIGERVDAPYSILSDLVDLEVFVDRAPQAERFDEFFTGVTVIDLAALGIGEKERNMLLVLFLNLYYEYMINLVKQPYLGKDPQLRFIDSMLLVDEADNIMKYNFDVLRQILLQGREFGIGVLLASQFLSHFKTRETDYSEPLLTWFIHKVPNVTSKELQSIGLNKVADSTVDKVKALDVHQCLFKTLDVPGRFMRTLPFYEIVDESQTYESVEFE